jgi:Na+-translocating ferredoxin:NAD+ oxidoreductase RNF subunit RnfB
MKEILFPLISLGGLGLLFGVILGYSSKKFAVEVNPMIPKVRECLPGANCGGCGFAGCDAFAEAVVNGAAAPNACPIGGESVATQIGNVLGVEVDSSAPMVAYVKCKGTKEKALYKGEYSGVQDCSNAVIVPGGGPKSCEFGCMGFGSCVKACKFDALHIVDGVALVDEEKCVGCGACVAKCPKAIIQMMPKGRPVKVTCNSKAKGATVKKICEVGCIGCSLCVKACPFDAIQMVNNLPVIDYDKCKNCGLCAKKCPTAAIDNFRKAKE